MSQHDLNIVNQTHTNFRQDLNNALEAIASKQSGSGDPTITYPFQEKIDTSASPAVVYIRNAANTAWQRIGYIDGTTGQLIMDDATDADTVDGKHITDIQNGSLVYCAVSGTDTYTGTLSPAITAYTQGIKVLGKVANANTSTVPTLNLNSIGAKKIFKEGGYALTAGDIPAGHHALFSYDSTLDSGSGGWLVLNPASLSSSSFPVGAGMDYFGVTAPDGWLFADGKTIGDASSGSTARANTDTETLFALLWNATANTELIIQDSSGSPTTRGASASADFAAHKRMPLPDKRGRVSVVKDNMGGTSANRVTSAQADLVCGNAGEETHVLSVAELPAHDHGSAGAHTHTLSYFNNGDQNASLVTTGAGSPSNQETTSSAGSHTHTSVGSGTAHNNMSPYLVCNYIIKY